MAGFPSEECVGDLETRGPDMTFVKCIFEIEPPSDLVDCGGIVLATERLVSALKAIEPTGVSFQKQNVKVEGDDNFADGTFKANFDEWWWLQLVGEPGVDDFAYEQGVIVSDRVIEVLRKFKLDYCEVFEYL